MNIIRDHLYLLEDYRVNEGLIEFESATLENDLQKVKQSAVVAVVGDYGSGKSTALYNIHKNDAASEWLQFDAWRYPERKGLWDGLVIEIAKQLGQDKKVSRRVDGNKSLIGKWGGIISETFSQFSELLPETEINKIKVDPAIADKAAKVTEKAQEIFGRSPVKRVYELERILADILVSVDKNKIYIVVEDIDRSGADGLNFLETLNFFIKHNEQVKESHKRIVVIAPIATKNYEGSKDSYYKCVDIAFYFAPKIKSASNLLLKIYTDEALGGTGQPYLENLNQFVIGLFENTSYRMSIRILKSIIRQAVIKYDVLEEMYENVDWRAVLSFEAMKFAGTDGTTQISVFDRDVIGHNQLSQQNIFTGLLMTVHFPDQPIYTYKYANSKKLEDRVFNRNIQHYKFLNYNPSSHGVTSVWIGQDQHYNRSGYVAEYYRT